MRSAGAVVAAITGNHDGADRVASSTPRCWTRAGSTCAAGYERVGQVVSHEFSDGPLDLALLPFLDPQAAPDDFGADRCDTDSTPDLVEQRRRRAHDSVLETAAALARGRLGAPRSLAVAHAYVSGATTLDSERQLVVGGTGEVPSTIFHGFSYTALGHLHRPQAAGAATIRYSGTPLAYSFSEEHRASIPWSCSTWHPRARPRSSRSRSVSAGGSAPSRAPWSTCSVPPTSTTHATASSARWSRDWSTVFDARSTLAERFPHIVEVRLMPDGQDPDVGAAPVDVSELPPIEAARQFWAAAEGNEPPEDIDEVLVAATSAALAGGDA